MAKFNEYDIVKIASNAPCVAGNIHSSDYIGLVKEAGNNNTFVEWYDAKSKVSTREVSNLTGWIDNQYLTFAGSLWHIVSNSLKGLVTPVNQTVMPVAVSPVATVAASGEIRTKRKYTRKPGAAKPGPKPKKTASPAVSAKVKAKVEKVEDVDETPVAKGNMEVPVPIGRWGCRLDREWFQKSYHKLCLPTGKFDNFETRPLIEKSIIDNKCGLAHSIQSGLDFAIVGHKPGPAKLKTFAKRGIPCITEEEWMAMIGCPGYEFSKTATRNAKIDIYNFDAYVSENFK